MPAKVSEATLRDTVRVAVRCLQAQGRRINMTALRKAGARGGDRRLWHAVEHLVRCGEVDAEHYNDGRDARTRVEPGQPADARRRRHPSRRWVREYFAAERNIRKVRDLPHPAGFAAAAAELAEDPAPATSATASPPCS
jgi:hypothetical protein